MMKLVVLAVLALCYNAQAKRVRFQVDDNMAMWADGDQKVNTLGRSTTWQQLYDGTIPDDTFVLAIKAFNKGGPGRFIVILDDASTKPGEWKCADAKTTNIEGFEQARFDDSAWVSPKVIPGAWSRSRGSFPSGTVSMWLAPGASYSQTIACRMIVSSSTFKMQVDDNMQAIIEGEELVNTLSQGTTWQMLFESKIKANPDVVAIKAKNNYGPGRAVVVIDGISTPANDWRCLNTKANPGVNLDDFDNFYYDDSGSEWSPAVNVGGKWSRNGGKLPANYVSFWHAQSQNLQTIACRRVKSIKIRMQCDDHIKAFADGHQVVDTFGVRGSTWQNLYTAKIPASTKVVAVRGRNDGGPGRLIVEVNGVGTVASDWKCLDLKANPDANTQGWTEAGFDDSTWTTPNSMPSNWSSKRNQFVGNPVSFWTQNNRFNQDILCRMVRA